MGRAVAVERLRGTRLALVLIALSLTVLGVLFIHSTTAGEARFPDLSIKSRGQLDKAIVGIVVFLFVARLDYRVWERHAYLLYLGLIGVLGGMLIARFISGGLLRDIPLYFFQVQPSEPMKVVLVLALARYLRFREDQRRLRGLVAPFS